MQNTTALTQWNKRHKQCLQWHADKVKENYVFDFQKEFLEYCDSDVDILRRGCLEPRKQFSEIADIDPFQYITTAGVCMAIYRSKYLQQKTIAIIKEDKKEMCSKGSITWLNTFTSVQHALHGGEINICGVNLTGSITKLILYTNTTGVSGKGALTVITKLQSTM